MAVVRDTSEATGLDQALAEIVEQAAGGCHTAHIDWQPDPGHTRLVPAAAPPRHRSAH